jgi:hypothetical protein
MVFSYSTCFERIRSSSGVQSWELLVLYYLVHCIYYIWLGGRDLVYRVGAYYYCDVRVFLGIVAFWLIVGSVLLYVWIAVVVFYGMSQLVNSLYCVGIILWYICG